MNYYNEWDKHAAAWLRELIKAGLIPNGDVDERSIKEVQPKDLDGYTQCHFFAGIGGWPYALRLAGWPEDREVWTGSCPCQPFSVAGAGRGESDERHLWPDFARLVRVRKPATVVGEQVASPLGRKWLSGVFSDLENMGYATAGADLCAAGVGSPHIRQRLYWVANSNKSRQSASSGSIRTKGGDYARWCGEVGGLGVSECRGWESGAASGPEAKEPGARCDAGLPWNNYEIIPCGDGKQRRIEPGTFPLAHGIPGRVGLLRGYGNAIVPQVAAEFVKAYMEI